MRQRDRMAEGRDLKMKTDWESTEERQASSTFSGENSLKCVGRKSKMKYFK
jgi:hypothetical protein